jgi:hypothetical protein
MMSKGNQPRIERERVGGGSTLVDSSEVSIKTASSGESADVTERIFKLEQQVKAIELWMDQKLGTHLASK